MTVNIVTTPRSDTEPVALSTASLEEVLSLVEASSVRPTEVSGEPARHSLSVRRFADYA